MAGTIGPLVLVLATAMMAAEAAPTANCADKLGDKGRVTEECKCYGTDRTDGGLTYCAKGEWCAKDKKGHGVCLTAASPYDYDADTNNIWATPCARGAVTFAPTVQGINDNMYDICKQFNADKCVAMTKVGKDASENSAKQCNENTTPSCENLGFGDKATFASKKCPGTSDLSSRSSPPAWPGLPPPSPPSSSVASPAPSPPPSPPSTNPAPSTTRSRPTT